MKKRLIVLLTVLFIFSPIIASFVMSSELFAAGTIVNSPNNQAVNSLHLGDEVHLGTYSDDVYTVLGQKNGDVYLLKKAAINNTAVNFNTAKTNATNFVSATNFGNVGKSHAQTGLISKADLSSLSAVSGNNLVSAIPSVTGNWWLADNNASTNRASFASASNALNVDGGIKKTTVSGFSLNSVTAGTCGTASAGETGVMPITAFNDSATPTVKRKFISKATIKFNFPSATGISRKVFSNSTNCTGTSGVDTLGQSSANINYAQDGNTGKVSWTAGGNGAGFPAAIIIGMHWDPRPSINGAGTYLIGNNSITTNFVGGTNGTCYAMYYNDSNILVDSKVSGNPSSAKYGTRTFTVTASISGTPTVQTDYCPALTNNAGTALVRPYVKVKATDIIMRNNAKRTYNTSAVLSNASLPKSDNAGTYLTLQASELSVGLNTGNAHVSGNTLTVERPKNNTIVSLPLTFGTVSEGTRYVAAEAKDKDGNAVYSVLGAAGAGNTANVNIDYANLLASGQNSFKVTLFLEDAGGKNTAYRSAGTEITVVLKDPQYIRFEAGNAGTVTYGDTLEIKAEYYDYDTLPNGDIKQANTDLAFRIHPDDTGKAYIEDHQYVASTGKAKATIVPTSGTGQFRLIISKSGDDVFYDAQEQTVTIQLQKKDLTLIPPFTSDYAAAALEDLMPSLEPNALILNPGDGLVSGDVVPSELYPNLEKDDPVLADHPAVGGVVSNPGTWREKFPNPPGIVSTAVTQFMDKYNVTFEDYDDDEDYVFTVDPNGILERWIEITPELTAPQTWYNADIIATKGQVTLKPSLEAKYFGYFDIALVTDGVDGTFDSSVVLTDDTTGIKPIVKLRKADGEISNAKQLNTKIKIDQTNPTLNINVPSGWASLKKTVQLQAVDATSGIDTTDADSVKAAYVDAGGVKHPITLTNNGGGSYTFDAAQNGLYEFVVKDKAGNEMTTFKNIQQIDMTAASLTAALGSLSAAGDYHEINVTRVEPNSGINYIQVYFQGDGDASLSLIGYLDRTQPSQVYQAPANGKYVFKMEIGSGEQFTAEVLVADITQLLPVVGINAINMGDNSAYIDDTWINQDVQITLSNLNLHFTDPITYQYRKTSDVSWHDLDANTLDITTNTWINERYEFRAVSPDVESLIVSIMVKIDKEKPQPPVMDHPEQLDDDYTFIDQAEISGHVLAKNSGIEQSWEYSLDDGDTWTPVTGDQFTITGAGDYELQVRTVDIAGNISDVDSYPVHIIGKPTQTIDFDDVPSAVTYGTCETITAKLTSDVDEQANTSLIFTIPASSQDKVAITSQSYNPNTGEATATICPKNGNVFFDIEISKAGDDQAYAAVTKTKTITLNKASLTVYPDIIYGKTVGDVMPTLASNGNGLVNNDTIPSALAITLTPDASTSDPLPTDAGNPIITHAGTWTMTYPANILSDSALADFVKKYDVTLEDYTTNTQYVFTVSDNGIPDSWVIVSPDPNSDGWNNTDVTLSLADDAIAAGYTELALIEQGVETLHGSTILLSNSTNGFTPVVVLKKPGETSGYKSLRYVKIDKSMPIANVAIDHENDWTNTDKKVTITVSDTYSGVKDLVITDSVGNPVSLTQDSANTYSFVSNNEQYHLTLSDKADNEYTLDFVVQRIDQTPLSITAALGALSADETTHDINVTATVGTSGVTSFDVYYKANAGDPYPATPLESLNPSLLTCTYAAHQNGFYRFTVVNGVGDSASDEVEVNDVVANYPVVAIQAEWDDGSHTPYIGGTWVNQNVKLTLTNTNATIAEPITYEYKKSGDATWTPLDADTLTMEEDDWIKETIEFHGVISTGAGNPTSIDVNIDKVKPDAPTIDNADAFTSSNAFAAPLTVTGSTTPKASGIGQKIMISKDHGISWEEMVGNKYTLTDPDHYSLTFKTVDEAGNESDEFTLEDVIVNDGTPNIEIKLNNNRLADILNHLTFGYFFKEHVDVDIEVNWYGMADGDVYYILDDSATPSVPAADDPRWTSGDHTSIDPDRKTMIYAKAVNSAGKIAMTSSTYYVIADQMAPTISFDQTYTDWISDNTLTATVSDALAGVDNSTIEAKVDNSNKGNVTASGSSLHFTDLPDGSYKLQVSAKDNSGNQADELIMVKIDTTAPEITGVKDKSVYHQYYLPRYITVSDAYSGMDYATIAKDGGSSEAIGSGYYASDIGSYEIHTKDLAGNEETVEFDIVALPDITTEIDCSEESKQIVEQIETEYAEEKDHMDETERNNIQKWLDDAHDVRNTCRIKIVYNEDKSAWVEGMGDVDFAADAVLVVEDIATNSLPNLPMKARKAYNVYLKLGGHEVQPDGMMKIHLPYQANIEQPVLYEIDDTQKVTKIAAQASGNHLIFEADELLKYAIAAKDGETCTITINQDSDSDGLPDINIDIDGDGKADINIDTDCDGIPDINIDTKGDGEPDYNVDVDDDGTADINIGALPKPWKPNQCQTVNQVKYCTMGNLTPHINIDTDDDDRPDMNLDPDGDHLPDLNIDADGDWIPDVNIDTDGDGKADINVDVNGDGVADLNLVRLTKWQPDADYEVNGFAYDTMTGLVPKYNIDTDNDGKADENLVDNRNNRYNLSGSSDDLLLSNRANTGDYTHILIWLVLFLAALVMDGYCFYQIKRRKQENR